MRAPERIWANVAVWVNGEPLAGEWNHCDVGLTDDTPFIRADLCADPALLAEAVEVLRECHDALRDHGKQYPHMVKGYTLDAETRARAFIAKWEARHDR